MRFSRGDVEEAELGLAPLLDVVLLLLIFFLVSTSFQTPRIPLELPPAGSAEAPRAAVLTVTLTADGGLFLGENETDLSSLETRLAEASPETELELRADTAVPHGRVMEILDSARRHGVSAIGIAVAHPRRS